MNAHPDPSSAGPGSAWVLVFWLVFGPLLLAVGSVREAWIERTRPHRPRVTEVPGLATGLDRRVNGISVVGVAGDSVLVAWTLDGAIPGRPFAPSRTIHWCYLGAFGAGDHWSRANRVDLGGDETVELLRAGEGDVYVLGRQTRRLFHVEPNLSLRLANRLDPPQAMAWQRFDAALLTPRLVVGAAAGLVPADSGRVRQVVYVGGWRVGGGLASWTQVAGGPTWPVGGARVEVEAGVDRPIVIASLADSTAAAARRGLADGSSRAVRMAAMAPDPDGRWRDLPEVVGGSTARGLLGASVAPDRRVWVASVGRTGLCFDALGAGLDWLRAGWLPRVHVGAEQTRVLCVPSPGWRAMVVHLDPEDHRYDPDNLVIALALHGLPQRVRYRSAVGVAEQGEVRDVPGAHLRGEVGAMDGAATNHGGVIVYETTERNWLQDESTRRLRVLRYAWPR